MYIRFVHIHFLRFNMTVILCLCMKPQTVSDIIDYWTKTAKHDFDTMLVLFETKRYSDSLFFGHIVLEKILKGLVVKNTKEQAPDIHDLVRLQELAGLVLATKEIDLLDAVNNFNIRSRYPEHKLLFYKTCTEEYTNKYYPPIIALYKKLCRKLKQKKS